MDYISGVDRRYIENKYHKQEEYFDAFDRMVFHGYDYDNATGLEDEEIRSGLNKLYEENKGLPHATAKALAIKYVLENTKIDVNEHDFFVGLWSANRLAFEVTTKIWHDEVFEKIIPDTKETMDDMNRSGAIAIYADFAAHAIPDWDSVLTLGFPGLLKRAEYYRDLHETNHNMTDERRDFFEGIIIEYQAIISLIDRLYRYAAGQTHEKAQKTAACLKSIRDGAPQNIYEALQLIYIYYMISDCFDTYLVSSLGNGLDQSLYTFYKNDLATGNFSREEMKELLAYFMMQWSAMGNYWGQSFYLGGTNNDGSTKYNELSYDILEVYDALEIYNPKIQVKVNNNTPDQLLSMIFDMIRRGHNSIVLCCEPGMMKAAMCYGATYQEALDMEVCGCYETRVRANDVSSITGHVNGVKAVEYVFSNGFDKTIGKQMGLETGELGSFATFEDFYEAVIKQWGNLIELSIAVSDQYEKYMSYMNPSNLYSATIEEALARGVDAYQGGAKFCNSVVISCSMASMIDSVMAVWEFVYDKKEITLEELKTALDNNWNGYERIRLKINASKHKYGNQDALTDIYTEAMAGYFAAKINNRPNVRGGVYKSFLHSALQFVEQGQKTGASPDGRIQGFELSKNASPSVGMDRQGITALINSVSKTNPYTYLEGHCLDCMLHPSTVSGNEGLQIMKSLLLTYMKNGGQSIQFNVFQAEMLKDAQKYPDKYKNLQVRVCGWNVLWNNLSREEQDAYIMRAENIGGV